MSIAPLHCPLIYTNERTPRLADHWDPVIRQVMEGGSLALLLATSTAFARHIMAMRQRVVYFRLPLLPPSIYVVRLQKWIRFIVFWFSSRTEEIGLFFRFWRPHEQTPLITPLGIDMKKNRFYRHRIHRKMDLVGRMAMTLMDTLCEETERCASSRITLRGMSSCISEPGNTFLSRMCKLIEQNRTSEAFVKFESLCLDLSGYRYCAPAYCLGLVSSMRNRLVELSLQNVGMSDASMLRCMEVLIRDDIINLEKIDLSGNNGEQGFYNAMVCYLQMHPILTHLRLTHAFKHNYAIGPDILIECTHAPSCQLLHLDGNMYTQSFTNYLLCHYLCVHTPSKERLHIKSFWFGRSNGPEPYGGLCCCDVCAKTLEQFRFDTGNLVY